MSEKRTVTYWVIQKARPKADGEYTYKDLPVVQEQGEARGLVEMPRDVFGAVWMKLTEFTVER